MLGNAGDRAERPSDNAKASSGRKDRKVAQRKRTRGLYAKLDPLVPLSASRPLGDKGSLPSKRTYLQLQDDTIEHLQALKAERLRCAREQARGNGQPEEIAPGQDGGAAAVNGAQPRETHPDGMADIMHAMLGSSMLMIEMDASSWTVLRASAGLRVLYRCHPRGKHTIVGESLLHYVDAADVTALRAAFKERCPPGGHACAPDVLLRIWLHKGHIQCCKFRVQRFGSSVQGRELLILDPHESMPPSALAIKPIRGTHAFGWTIEKMRDMSAVYRYDVRNTTTPPWVLDAQLAHMEPGGGLSQSGLSYLLSTETSNHVVHSMVTTQGGSSPSIFNSWSTRLKSLVYEMFEMHLTFDAKSDNAALPIITIHIRLRLPAGGLRTPWVFLDRLALDGTTVSKLSAPGKEIRVFAQSSCDQDELRLCSMFFGRGKPARTGADACARQGGDDENSHPLECYHSRQWVVDAQGIRINGEITKSAHEGPIPFIESFKRVEDADRELVSSLLLEAEDPDPLDQNRPAHAEGDSSSRWGLGLFPSPLSRLSGSSGRK